ncbi:MAG: thiamine pyrophosphate-dependent dehydrogenase E1 component subunit alpha [Anaerolineaceae bacterium]|nr:thiamine pyrophosphate-dependent dehydrogenase E1 component subunit alpha [Anaerolineaceae bacterium]
MIKDLDNQNLSSDTSKISTEVLLDMYRRMVTIRKFEETVYDVYSRGIMPGLAHLYTGMEAVAVGVCVNLKPTDNITSTHRGHGHLLAKGGEPKRMFAELLGKASGYNHGKGGSMHIVDMSLGILGANGIVAGGMGIAAGAALSAKVRHEDRVSVMFFGDGALNEGLFYETANIASLWKLPVVYIMENNTYGEYTSTKRSTAGTGPARAEAMMIPAVSVDGNDVLAVYEAAAAAIEQVRAGSGPRFVECHTYRWRGHHMGDQGDTYGYRTQEEIEGWMKKDPIPRFGQCLLEDKRTDADALAAIDAEVKQLIDEAVEFAKQAPYPDPSEVYKHVYA